MSLGLSARVIWITFAQDLKLFCCYCEAEAALLMEELRLRTSPLQFRVGRASGPFLCELALFLLGEHYRVQVSADRQANGGQLTGADHKASTRARTELRPTSTTKSTTTFAHASERPIRE